VERGSVLKEISMADNLNICEQDNYDNYEINTRSDLFRLIELRLREARGIPPIKGTMGREVFLRNAYEEALGYVKKLRKANPELIEPPPRTPNDEGNLINLRDWCTDPRGQAQQRTTAKDVIIIDASKFSNSKTWRLLKAIIDDERRNGMRCENPRTLRTLKERLKKTESDSNKNDHIKLAKSLKYKDGLARTTINFGKIQISPKKNNSAENSALP